LIIEPGVEVVGNGNKIKVGGRLYAGYVEGHKNDNPKNEKVTIKNTSLEAAGTGDRIMNLSHLDISFDNNSYINDSTKTITISSRERILTLHISRGWYHLPL